MRYVTKEQKAKHIEEQRRYKQRHPGRTTKALAEYRKRLRKLKPQVIRATNAIGKAVHRGQIKKPAHCTRCGMPCNPEGHHPDYSKPLEVIWLCNSCHRKEHGK